MKKVSRWLAGICAAVMLIGTAGAGSVPARAADTAALQLVTPNETSNFEYRQPKDIVVKVTNPGDSELAEVKVSVKLKDPSGKWPFMRKSKNDTERVLSLGANESKDVTFAFTQRDDAGNEDYELEFTAIANVGGNDVTGTDTAWAHTSAEPKEPSGEKEPSQNPAPSPVPEEAIPEGGVGNSEAAYVGGGGSGNSSVPRVIVTGFTTNPAEVKAGSNFVLTIHLRNTSRKTRVKNMLFELQAPTEGKDEQSTAPAFLPSSGSNSIYLEGIPAGGMADISIELNAKADLAQKPYEIGLSMKYEDSAASQIEASANLSIPVKQNVRFEFSEFEITPESVEVGSEANVSCNIYNLGRIKLYNVKAIFEGSGIKREEVYLGNLDSGSSTAIDAMLEGTKVSEEGKVKMTLSYEDEAGAVSTAEKELKLPVMEAMDSDMAMDGMINETKSGFPIVPIGIVAVMIAAIIAVIAIKKKRKARGMLAEEEGLLDELDRPSGDEQQ